MLQALLRGKLSRDQENMEDLLTSAVFGRLTYVPPHDGLFPLLAQAEAIDRSKPLNWLNDTTANARVEFWPTWNHPGYRPCEPDVAIEIGPFVGRPNLRIAIEAKYLSGKSSEASDDLMPTDQLANEWNNLSRIARDERSDPWLIYMTTAMGVPISEIEESIKEYTQKLPQFAEPKILALSWRQVAEVFHNSDNPILLDLRTLMKRLGMLFYRGFGTPQPVRRWDWAFTPLQAR